MISLCSTERQKNNVILNVIKFLFYLGFFFVLGFFSEMLAFHFWCGKLTQTKKTLQMPHTIDKKCARKHSAIPYLQSPISPIEYLLLLMLTITSNKGVKRYLLSIEIERIDKTYQRNWTNNRFLVCFFLFLVFSLTEGLVSAQETLSSVFTPKSDYLPHKK